MRSSNQLLTAMFASEPQTEGFPNVSPIQGLLEFMLQCLSVL